MAAGALAFPGMWSVPAYSAVPKRLVYISDQGQDPDDPADAGLIAYLTRRHEFTLLASLGCHQTGFSTVAGRIILEDYYQIPNIRFGAYKGTSVPSSVGGDCWGAALRTIWRPGETDAIYPDSTTVLLDVLTNSPDNSVTIINTGMASVEADALRASGGPALIAAKVNELIWVAGTLPTGADGFNIVVDNVDGQYLAANWPTTVPFIWCGLEIVTDGSTGGVWNGPPVGDNPATRPIKYAFDNACAGHVGAGILPDNPGGKRWSWSGPGILHAAFPGVYTALSAGGTVTVDGSSNTTWTAGGSGNHKYLTLTTTPAALTALFDSWLTAPSGAFPGAVLSSGTIKSNATVKVQ